MGELVHNPDVIDLLASVADEMLRQNNLWGEQAEQAGGVPEHQPVPGTRRRRHRAMSDDTVRDWLTGWGTNTQPTGIQIIWEEGTGGYEWSCYAILRRAHGETFQYATYVDGGCSCNYAFEEHPDTYNFQWTFDLKTAVRELSDAVRKTGSYDFSDGEKAELLASLARLR